jgi:hypothetical protein
MSDDYLIIFQRRVEVNIWWSLLCLRFSIIRCNAFIEYPNYNNFHKLAKSLATEISLYLLIIAINIVCWKASLLTLLFILALVIIIILTIVNLAIFSALVTALISIQEIIEVRICGNLDDDHMNLRTPTIEIPVTDEIVDRYIDQFYPSKTSVKCLLAYLILIIVLTLIIFLIYSIYCGCFDLRYIILLY